MYDFSIKLNFSKCGKLCTCVVLFTTNSFSTYVLKCKENMNSDIPNFDVEQNLFSVGDRDLIFTKSNQLLPELSQAMNR